jgi:hypothetical protein
VPPAAGVIAVGDATVIGSFCAHMPHKIRFASASRSFPGQGEENREDGLVGFQAPGFRLRASGSGLQASGTVAPVAKAPAKLTANG